MAGRLEGKYGEVQTTPEAELKNWTSGTRIFFTVFYYSLGGFAGPYRTMNDMERFQCMSRNAAENETYFLLLAYAWTLVELPDWAGQALEAYVYSRIAHFVAYCFLRIQPWRALLWTVGVVINMVMAGHILMQTTAGATKEEL